MCESHPSSDTNNSHALLLPDPIPPHTPRTRTLDWFSRVSLVVASLVDMFNNEFDGEELKAKAPGMSERNSRRALNLE
jgi:hypothetical protein